jgi:hypothetical protein
VRTGDDADASYHPTAEAVVGLVARQGAELQEGRSVVEQERKTFAHEELATLAVSLLGSGTPTFGRPPA